MPIELKRTTRVAFPTGIMDFVASKDDSSIHAACMNGIYQWSLAKEPTKPLRIGGHQSYVSGIAWDEERGRLVSVSYDGTLQIRESTETEVIPSVDRKIHSFWSWGMAMSPDHQWVASASGQYLVGDLKYGPRASEEPTVKVLSASTGEVVHAFEMLPSVQCVAFDGSSKYLAAGNLMGDVAVWDVVTGARLAAWRTDAFTSWGIIKSHCYIGGIFAIAFSPDGQSVYVAGMGDMRDPMAGNGRQLWQRFDWRGEPPEKLQETVADQAGEGLMETLAWHPSGEWFVMAGRLRGGNWNLGAFSTESGQLIGQAKTGMRITTARFSTDGRHLWLGGMQGQPGPKDGVFPEFGYLERYEISES